jgi:hypothetical protein
MTTETNNTNATETVDNRTAEQIRLDELKAELAKAEEVVREQAREVKRQEEEAKRKVETAKRIAANQPKVDRLNQMAAMLMVQLEANGITGVTVQPSFVDEYGSVKMPSFEGISYTVKPYFEVRYSQSGSWRPSANGYKVTVGEVGNKKTFLQLKDGSFNYAKIAEEVALRISASKVAGNRAEEARLRRATVRAAANGLVQVLGGTVREGSYDTRGRYHESDASIIMSVETAQLLADRIAELEAMVANKTADDYTEGFKAGQLVTE